MSKLEELCKEYEELHFKIERKALEILRQREEDLHWQWREKEIKSMEDES